MDAPGVGLEASEAGEHKNSEEECQHGEAKSGICDQGQRLQISLQLLLRDVRVKNRVKWIYNILVRVDEKEGQRNER